MWLGTVRRATYVAGDEPPHAAAITSCTFKRFRVRALARPGVKKAYDELDEKFACLDEVLEARAEAGLSQAEVAARAGQPNRLIARFESAEPKRPPSIATLQKYAKAPGYRVQIRLVKSERGLDSRRSGRAAKSAARRRAWRLRVLIGGLEERPDHFLETRLIATGRERAADFFERDRSAAKLPAALVLPCG